MFGIFQVKFQFQAWDWEQFTINDIASFQSSPHS